jgi:hypothetical protein
MRTRSYMTNFAQKLDATRNGCSDAIAQQCLPLLDGRFVTASWVLTEAESLRS